MSLEFLSSTQSAEFAEPSPVRMQKGLQNPGSPGSMQLGAINKISQARIRWALSELTGLQLDKVGQWFDDLAKDSPAKALELLIELLKFTTPQQKSMTVEAGNPGEAQLPQLSLKELQGMVFRGIADQSAPVSEQ